MRHAFVIASVVVIAACRAEASDDYLGDKAPKALGLGHAPTAAEVAALDIDVSPNGAGLPAGSGTPEQGATIFASTCASCHGKNGEGTPPAYPQLVGGPKGTFNFATDYKIPRTIGNYWPYATTVFDLPTQLSNSAFIRKMGWDTPSKLHSGPGVRWSV